MKNGKWIIYCALWLLAGCTQQAPQRPSRRMGETPNADSAELALLEMNRQLALSADKQVAQAAREQTETYALYDGNAWLHIIDRGEPTGTAPQNGEERTVRMRICTLDGQLLEDTEHSYRIGKYELPFAVETNIDELHRGGRMRMYAPWYTAFGAQGTAHIPAYENVLIEIELK